MNILLAFDKFKGALTAAEACETAAAVLRESIPQATVELAPLTDGGEGFCSILTEGANGTLAQHEVSDPLARPISAAIGWVDSSDLSHSTRDLIGIAEGKRIAVIEMASASGLLLLDPDERDPWKTSTKGTGELIRIAAENGADLILLGVGGSATNDCGTGVLEALGVGFTKGRGTAPRQEVRNQETEDKSQKSSVLGEGPPLDQKLQASIVPDDFAEVDTVDFSLAVSLPPIVIASDVESPLLGETGATRVFGPQKGLETVEEMESAFERIALLLATGSSLSPDPSSPGMGAAGGIAFGLSAMTGTTIVPGFSLVSEWMGLPAKLKAADVLFTGEGKMYQGSLSGKGPVALLRAAAGAGVNLVVVAGIIEKGIPEALSHELGECTCYQLSEPEWNLKEALARAESRLAEVVRGWAIR